MLQIDYDILKTLVNSDKITKSHTMEIWTVAAKLRATFQQQLKQKVDKKVASKMYVSLSGTKPTHDTNYV